MDSTQTNPFTQFRELDEEPSLGFTPTPEPQQKTVPAPTVDSLFPYLVVQESRGNQAAVSPKGATGLAQIMRATGPEAAALAGLPWDEEKWKGDREYNAALGKAYLGKQLTDFGEPGKALAAYNAGPGAVRRAMEKAKQLGGDWMSYLPAETQGYVPKVLSAWEKSTSKAAPAPAAPAKVNPFTQFREGAKVTAEDLARWSAKADEAEADKASTPSFGQRMVGDIAAIGDFIWGVLPMMAGVGANLSSTAIGLVAGESPKEAWGAGRAIGHRVSEPISNPLQKLLSLSPAFARAYQESVLTGGLEKLNSLIEDAGEYVEKKSGGAVIKEQVQTGFDVLLTAFAGRGIAKGSAPRPLYQQPKGGAGEVPEHFKARQPGSRAPEETVLDPGQYETGRVGGTLPPQPPKLLTDKIYSPREEATRATEQPAGPTVEPAPAPPVEPAPSAARPGRGPARTLSERAREIEEATDVDVPEQLKPLLWAGAGVSAAALYSLFEGDDGSVGAMAAAGMFKPLGGQWHPQAAYRLTSNMIRPFLAESRTTASVGRSRNDPVIIREDTIERWLDDRIKKYLNRDAGTERDPLDKIPINSSGKTWGENFRELMFSGPKTSHDTFYGSEKVPDTENIWGLQHGSQGDNFRSASIAMSRFLEKVGEYIKDNVLRTDKPLRDWFKEQPKEFRDRYPHVEKYNLDLGKHPWDWEDAAYHENYRSDVTTAPEWLAYKATNPIQRYDFARAAKETAIVEAKKAENRVAARKAAVAEMPTYREYETGERWVENKIPDKLSPEQAKFVVPVAEAKLSDTARAELDPTNKYIALDYDGKPVRTTWGGTAGGRTPEEAYFSGLLGMESQVMGNSVSGYGQRLRPNYGKGGMDAIIAGKARIISLKDKDGISRATVELIPSSNPYLSDPIWWVRTKGDYSSWAAFDVKYDKLSDAKKAELKEKIAASKEYKAYEAETMRLQALGPPEINQIKYGAENGMGNKTTYDPTWGPFVRDLVKSKRWGSVGDLSSTGLVKLRDGYHTPEEIKAAVAKTPKNPKDTDPNVDEVIKNIKEATPPTDMGTLVDQLSNNYKDKLANTLIGPAAMLAAVGVAQLFEGDDGSFETLAAAGLLFVVKPPRDGRFHPQAGPRLSYRILDHLAATERDIQYALEDYQYARHVGDTAALPGLQTSIEQKLDTKKRVERIVQDWLNQHAGQATDPLRGIDVRRVKRPGDEPILLGDLIAEAIGHKPVEMYQDPSTFKGTPRGTKIWNVAEPGDWTPEGEAAQKIVRFFGEVGQHIKEEMNPQQIKSWNFPRLVQEMIKDREAIIRETALAARQATKQLKPARVYKDGKRWVEFTPPEKLAPDQAKTVREATPDEVNRSPAIDMTPEEQAAFNMGTTPRRYVALNPRGKPIQKVYDGDVIGVVDVQRTPEEAWLAGKMAQEGNAMANCTAVYCGKTLADKVRVYGLRSEKGDSLAVVRMERDTPWNFTTPPQIGVIHRLELRFPGTISRDYAKFQNPGPGPRSITDTGSFWEWMRQNRPDVIKELEAENANKPWRLQEMKYSHNNRTWEPDVGPYIQDFVKSREWGEVSPGDLRNVQLTYLDPATAAASIWTKIPSIDRGYLKPNWISEFPKGLYTEKELKNAGLKAIPSGLLEDWLSEKYPQVDVDIIESKQGLIEIANIALRPFGPVRPSHLGIRAANIPRGSKFGQEALQGLTEWADANGKSLAAVVEPKGEFAPPLEKLEEIFGKQGFKPGPVQRFEGATMMYREPYEQTKGTGPQTVEEPQRSTTPLHAEGNEVPPGGAQPPGGFWRNEGGFIDPELAKTLGAVGAGAALFAWVGSDEHRKRNFVLGGLAVLGAQALRSRKTREQIEYPTTPISNRVVNMAPPIWRRLNDTEYGIQGREAAMTNMVMPWAKDFHGLSKPMQADMESALLTGDPVAINAAIAANRNPGLHTTFARAKLMLDQVGQELMAAGRLQSLLHDYWPRRVKDREGLMTHLGLTYATRLERLLADRAKTLGRPLTAREESDIINNYLLAPLANGGIPGWAQGRTIPQITKDLSKFYHGSIDSMGLYIHDVATELEAAKFFGQDARFVQSGGRQHLNYDASIGEIVSRELNAGRLTGPQAIELKGILESRFRKGEIPSKPLVQDVRNMTSAGLITNPLSAIGQFSDLAPISIMYGPLTTLTSLMLTLSGKATLRPEDIGVIRSLGEEFLSSRGTARFFNATARASLFAGADWIMKATALTAARRHWEGLAQTARGRQRIIAEQSEAYGSDLPQLINDLRARQLTPLTRPFFFGELSRIQPLSKFEMTQAYLDNPNLGMGVIPVDGRSAFQLKTWMIKNIGFIQRELWKEASKGRWGKAFVKGVKIMVALGLAGATTKMLQDLVLGRPLDQGWDDVAVNMLKTFGLSEYVLDKVRKDKPLEAAWSFVAPPPFKIFDQLYNEDESVIQYIPVGGKLVFKEEWSKEGKAKGEDDRMKEKQRALERERQPLIGNPRLNPRAMKERRQEIRDEFPGAVEREKERRRIIREEREKQ